MSVNLDITRFDKTLNIASGMQFVNNHFFKYPIFMSKTTLLLKHMTAETY